MRAGTPNKPDAANPAIASLLHPRHHGRGVGEATLGGIAHHGKLERETSMTNANQTQEIQTDEVETAAEGRSGRVETAAYLAGFSAFIGFVMLPRDATIGTGIAIAGIAGMVAAVCYFILRAR
jgi:hypothetical protein